MCLAVPGIIESIDDTDPFTRTGRVNFGGIKREVNLMLLPEAAPNQYVLVHAGVAIGVIDEVKAQAMFSLMDSMALKS